MTLPRGQLQIMAARFRRELLRQERQAAASMVAEYRKVVERLRPRIEALTAQIEQARAEGRDPAKGWLFERNRLQDLQRQVEAEVDRFSRYSERRIIVGKRVTAALGQTHAEQLTFSSLKPPLAGLAVSWTRLPAGAVEALAGHMADGSPLSRLLAGMGAETGKGVRQALLRGVAVGHNPRRIAREINRELGVNIIRARTIARTEMLRAYREASRQSYQANSDLLEGWVWSCACDARSCAMCWAMHGTLHKLSEEFATHPNCRCSMAPRTKSWAEISGDAAYPDDRPPLEKGTALFERLSEADKRRVLGPSAYRAYADGAVKLRQFVGTSHSREWGKGRYTRSLRRILGPTKAGTYRYLRSPQGSQQTGQTGGIFVPSPVPLPADLQAFIDSAESGKLQPVKNERELYSRIRQAEDLIRQLKHGTEHTFAFDRQGRVVLSKTGDPGTNRVGFTPQEVDQMRGMIVIHNHPIGWDYPASSILRGGNSFSDADIHIACIGEAAETRAVSPWYRFVMRPPQGGWNENYWRTVLRHEYNYRNQEVKDEFKIAIKRGDMSKEMAAANHYHEAWKRVCRTLRIPYTRVRR